ncbi:hypothetical protein AC249_AIPGENE10261 [Exaiptasia diaphana]|nr:hypothetical protein AC249_AIPGENE10261 [Exaiptasia diaphana]
METETAEHLHHRRYYFEVQYSRQRKVHWHRVNVASSFQDHEYFRCLEYRAPPKKSSGCVNPTTFWQGPHSGRGSH